MSKLLTTIVDAIEDKKGENIVSIDLTGFDGAICDHFVICNAESTTQVGAIADSIAKSTRERLSDKAWRINGMESCMWVAMDYGDIIVHIFQTEMRNYYRLEELWADAPLTRYE